jgi:8-oxo-dGTP diphosphatase
MGETPEACGRRELAEEAGLIADVLTRGPYTNDVFEADDKHYVTLFFVADGTAGEPELREPDKCSGWAWFAWDELPEPLFLPIINLRAQGWAPD